MNAAAQSNWSRWSNDGLRAALCEAEQKSAASAWYAGRREAILAEMARREASAGGFRVELDPIGFTIVDKDGQFVAGPFSQRFKAQDMANLWNEFRPQPHSAEWWELYRDSNPQLDRVSLDNIDMLIRRAKS